MEGAAWGRWRRARRSRGGPRRRSPHFPRFSLFLLFLHLRASPSIGYLYPVQYFRQILEDAHTVKLEASLNFPVKVYVMLHHKSPHILCLTQRLRNTELIDPAFHWHAPIDNADLENSSLNVTSTGSLIFQNFTEKMTGIYTCTLSYKSTAEEVEKNLHLKYVIYAYVNPSFYYKFTARYHSAPCNSIYNVSFEKKLLQILNKLVAELFCEIKLVKSECHQIKMQRAGLQNELFFTFSVISVENGTKGPDECTDSSCHSVERLNKAKSLIERFFVQQVEVLQQHLDSLPQIYFIEGTLQMMGINLCIPGFGMNPLLHQDCADCCVICSPGTYNPSSRTHCLPCNGSMEYGARKC